MTMMSPALASSIYNIEWVCMKRVLNEAVAAVLSSDWLVSMSVWSEAVAAVLSSDWLVSMSVYEASTQRGRSCSAV